jgi:hypothetical protein
MKKKRIRGDLRQLLHKRPFRIQAPMWTPELEDAIKIRLLPPEREKPLESPDASRQAETRELTELLRLQANGLYRIRTRMPAPGAPNAADAVRRARGHVESTWDAVKKAKVEIHDHTGERYVDGMAVKVLAFQPTAGITFDAIIETVKPSIFYRDKLIQMGEVVVGTPQQPAPTAPKNPEPAPGSK